MIMILMLVRELPKSKKYFQETRLGTVHQNETATALFKTLYLDSWITARLHQNLSKEDFSKFKEKVMATADIDAFLSVMYSEEAVMNMLFFSEMKRVYIYETMIYGHYI